MDNFKILVKLGQGSFGCVYKVKRHSDNQIYAIKKIPLTYGSRSDSKYSLNEVRLLASLQHPNVIGFQEAFVYGRYSQMKLCIVMEYAGGGDLSKIIGRHRRTKSPLLESRIWKYAKQISDALCYLHKNNILHRDIKAANCFLSQGDNIKLGDMNISKIVPSNGLARTRMGTPYYMSPEIWKNKSYDEKCDVWSLGCLVYELASFDVPFKAQTQQALSKIIITGKYRHIPNHNFSRSLWKCIYTMLKVQPTRRPSMSSLYTLCKEKEAEFSAKLEERTIKPLPRVQLLRTIPMLPTVEQLTKQLPKSKYHLINKAIPVHKSPIPLSFDNKNIFGERKLYIGNKKPIKQINNKVPDKYFLPQPKKPYVVALPKTKEKPKPYARIIPSKKPHISPTYANQENPFKLGKAAQVRLEALAAIQEYA